MNCQVRARLVFRRNCFGVVGPKCHLATRRELMMTTKMAVLVIHGVGDTRPGHTVDRLLSSLTKTDWVKSG